MKKVLKVIGIALLVIVAMIAVFLFWLTHRSSLKEYYRDSLETSGSIEAAYLQDRPCATSYYE